MSENLYIRSHRYTNPEYRDEYERIFEGRNKIIIFDDTDDGWEHVAAKISTKLDKLNRDIEIKEVDGE